MSEISEHQYTSAGVAAARFVTQQGMLRPFVRSVINLHVHGKEYLDSLGKSYIVIGNHSSHLDAAIILTSLPLRLSRYLATGAAADYFFDKWYKALGTRIFFNTFPIERKGPRTRRGLAGTLVSDGVPLLLFPEGTRSRTGAMAPFKPGAAALCISRNVPCLPVALVGAFAAWPTSQSKPPKGRPDVHCVFGRPMYPMPGEIAHQFSARMYRQVQELHDTTARAYSLPTLDDYARADAVREAGLAQNRAAERAARASVAPVIPSASPEPEVNAGTTAEIASLPASGMTEALTVDDSTDERTQQQTTPSDSPSDEGREEQT